MSSSTAEVDTGAKKDLYERVFRTRNYFVFDPFDPDSLAGWRLDENLSYQPIMPKSKVGCGVRLSAFGWELGKEP
jgi:Uma2 family endonuclease